MNPYLLGTTVNVYDEVGNCPLKVRWGISGTIACYDLVGAPMHLVPPHCLDNARLNQLKKKMEKQIHSEMIEMDRAQAKNSLENFLREELAKEVRKIESFYSLLTVLESEACL